MNCRTNPPDEDTTEKFRFHSHIKRNREYYELVIPICLSIVAIVVSCASIITATRTNQLGEFQADIARQAMMPQIYVHAEQHKSGKLTNYDEDIIYIENQGKPLREFHSQHLVVFKLKYNTYPSGQPSETANIEFFVSGYYNNTFKIPTTTGLLAKIGGGRNYAYFSQLQEDLSEDLASNRDFAYLSLERYVRISYKDQLNQRHTEYYKVEFVGGAEEIDLDQGKDLFNRMKESNKNNIRSNRILETITATDLLAEAMAAAKPH